MAFYDDDIDESLLVEIPCEFCNDPFPILFLTEHQTGCRYDLVRFTEPTVAEIEDIFAGQEIEKETPKIGDVFVAQEVQNKISDEKDTKIFEDATPFLDLRNNISQPNEDKKQSQGKKSPNFFTRLRDFFNAPLESKPKEKAPTVKESPKEIEKEKDFLKYEVLDEDLLEDYEAYTLGSKNKGKKVEEKPNFKVPNFPILDDDDSKCFIRNDLPDSDNEESESLEQYWEKAKIILAQRLRAMDEKNLNKPQQ